MSAKHDMFGAISDPMRRPEVNAIAGAPSEAIKRTHGSFLRWGPPVRSASSEMRYNKALADGRAFDLTQGDALVQGGVTFHKDAVVGPRYALNSMPVHEALGKGHDEVWASEFSDEVEAKFMLAADSPRNLFDYQQMRTFTEIIRLAVGISIYSGEYLQSHEWDKRDKLRPFKTCVLPIAPERLSNPGMAVDSNFMRGGVERDLRGAIVAYHIRQAHPSDLFGDVNRYAWNRVPARKPWGRPLILHVFEHTLADQNRQMSILTAGLEEMQMLRKFRRTVLQSALVQSTYAATIESELPTDVVMQSLGPSASQDRVAEAISHYGLGYLNSVSEYLGDSNTLEIDGVRIPHLFPGTKLQLRPAVGGDRALGTEFEMSMMRYLATIFGISTEEFSRDMRGANYTTMRAAMGLTDRALRARKALVADKVATAIFRLWLEEMMQTGEITALPRRKADLYDGLNFDAYSACSWIGASRGQIDALHETEAAALRIASNLSTLEAESASMGYDYRRVIKQRARERKLYKENGLSDSSAPVASVSGSPPGQDPAQPADATGQGDAPPASNPKKAPAKKGKTK